MKKDEYYMRRALALAKKGLGKTSPNPMVGAVVVKHGKIVGEDYHHCAGKPHAEVLALQKAGKKAIGADIYITLEPCTHTGRTPPCAPRVIQSGIKRAVIGTEDPNPKVAGAGIQALKESGIELTVGILQEECKKLNEVFFHWVTTGTPFVLLKSAFSLDGKIATKTGESKWISSEESRKEVHKMRARVDAVLVGIGTVLADDPQLTARTNYSHKEPLPIILDTHLRTPVTAKVLEHPRGCLIVAGKSASSSRRKKLEEAGARILIVKEKNGFIKWNDLLKKLGQMEITSVLIEGGTEIFSSAFENRIVNKVVFFIAPILIGGKNAKSMFEGEGFDRLKNCLKLRNVTTKRIGQDIMVEGYF